MQQKITEMELRQLFNQTADVQFQTYQFQSSTVSLITCEAMIDTHLLNEVIVPRVKAVGQQQDESIEAQLYVPGLQQVESLSEVVTLVFTGFVVIYFEQQQLLFSSNIAKKPNRNPEETNLEVLIKGPRDNFIEDIGVNIAIIRKRLPTNSLSVEKYTVGRRSKTTVALLYMNDIANDKILQGIRKQIKEIDTDVMISADLLMERITGKGKLIPRTTNTARGDFAVQSLVSGRFLILVDGVSYSVIFPINLFMLLKTSEDNEYPVIFSSFERLLRLVGILFGLLLPAFWLALTTFHQEQLPFQLLATIVQSNRGLPLPSALEMLLMLLMFELFREAGLRLPSIIGGTISVVGGLIIGDAAIRAGVTSPAMIVVIAISTIATFTLVNQALVTAVNLLRVCFILVTAVCGLFGFFVCLYMLLTYLAGIRLFGIPYLNIATDLKWETVKKTLIREVPQQKAMRPNALHLKDKTKGGKK
ncbi:spore germination protein [Lysinibacillus louembei]|uniref:Spore germination protein n=1 Tax=Lysinibacillus louembei TaxID=1470088 RepID=A0ABZ0RTM0_9BACI|nr:spore germination protein [Lysinibacillus louembei]WPK10769.1 spore germination protein [Lysinibacillus louembei]